MSHEWSRSWFRMRGRSLVDELLDRLGNVDIPIVDGSGNDPRTS